jgi:serine/threonine protein kinase
MEKSRKKNVLFLGEDNNNNLIKCKSIGCLLKGADVNFVDFIEKCLKWEASDRISPEEGLLHPFIVSNMNFENVEKIKSKIKKIKNENYLNKCNKMKIKDKNNNNNNNYCKKNDNINKKLNYNSNNNINNISFQDFSYKYNLLNLSNNNNSLSKNKKKKKKKPNLKN